MVFLTFVKVSLRLLWFVSLQSISVPLAALAVGLFHLLVCFFFGEFSFVFSAPASEPAASREMWVSTSGRISYLFFSCVCLLFCCLLPPPTNQLPWSCNSQPVSQSGRIRCDTFVHCLQWKNHTGNIKCVYSLSVQNVLIAVNTVW